jgi:hypothetical protein
MCSGKFDVFARNRSFPDHACVNAAHWPRRVEESGTGAHTGPGKPFPLLRGMEQFFHHFGCDKRRYHLGRLSRTPLSPMGQTSAASCSGEIPTSEKGFFKPQAFCA